MGATAKASSQGLEKVKQAIAKKGWRKTSPAFSDMACVSTATLKRFWRGIPIGLDSFKFICQAVNVEFDQVVALDLWMEKARSPIPSNLDSNSNLSNSQLSTLDPNSRQGLRQSLRHQLLESVRVLAITGLTGIGKTTLAHQLADDLEAAGYSTIYLTCDPIVPLTLASVVHALSKCDRAAPVTFSLSGLSDRLTTQKYLFIIDNCEHLLVGDPNSDWDQFQSSLWHPFFQSILDAPSCHSRFILTSQDVPNAIDSSRQPQPARRQICALAGLIPTEQATLFQNAGLTAPHQSDCLAAIGQAYAGHPLALQTVANDIVAHYHSASDYWQQHNATTNLHSHSQALQLAMQPRLVQTIIRLKNQRPDAFKLLCASNRYATPITAPGWMQIAQDLALVPGCYQGLLNLLCDRAFLIPTIIQNRLHFYPHPLIRSLVLTQIHGISQTVLLRTKQSAHKSP